MELNSHWNWIEKSTTKIFPVIFHWSPINNEWWKIPFVFFQWFTIEFPLITHGSTYLLNFPTALLFAPHWLPLVPIHYHSAFFLVSQKDRDAFWGLFFNLLLFSHKGRDTFWGHFSLKSPVKDVLTLKILA